MESLALLVCQGCAQMNHPSAQTSAGRVRPVAASDLDRVEDFCQEKFHRYTAYQPLYYNVASDSRAKHLLYLAAQMTAGKQIMLVHENAGRIDGFLMANILAPPPIYDSKLVTCMVDDFVVADPSLWPTTGAALLDEAERLAKSRGAIQTVAVCGHGDESKRQFLASRGLTISAEWYTKPMP